MKIAKIQFDNHPILGNTELNFTKSDGTIHDTIILAGENGTGKTTILDTISKFASLSFSNATITVRLSDSDMQTIIEIDHSKPQHVQLFPGMDDNAIRAFVGESFILSRPTDGTSGCIIRFGASLPNGISDIRVLNASGAAQNCFSEYFYKLVIKLKKNDRELTFVKPTNTSDISVDESNANKKLILANELNVGQLLVSINYQDSSELQNKARVDLSSVTPDDIENRVSRFRNAFNKFFDNGLKFKEISGYDILFTKDGVDLPMEALSSGEKLIIQTGAFLLKDINVDEPFLSLLDEPEQSLHPLWEDKILDYHKDILKKPSGQASQLFVVTHSEYVVRDAYEAGDLIIVAQRDHDNNKLLYASSLSLNTFPFSPTYSEIKYKAFNLTTTDFHIELFGYLHSLLQDKGYCDSGIASIDNYLDSVSDIPRIPDDWPNLRDDKTLPVYIRNYFDHPDCASENPPIRRKPDLRQISESIEFMIKYIKTIR